MELTNPAGLKGAYAQVLLDHGLPYLPDRGDHRNGRVKLVDDRSYAHAGSTLHGEAAQTKKLTDW